MLGWSPEIPGSGKGVTWGCLHIHLNILRWKVLLFCYIDNCNHRRSFPSDPLVQLALLFVWMGSCSVKSLYHICVEYNWPLRGMLLNRQEMVFCFWLCKPVSLSHRIQLEHWNPVPLWSSRTGPKVGTFGMVERTWALKSDRGFCGCLCYVSHKVMSDRRTSGNVWDVQHIFWHLVEANKR